MHNVQIKYGEWEKNPYKDAYFFVHYLFATKTGLILPKSNIQIEILILYN